MMQRSQITPKHNRADGQVLPEALILNSVDQDLEKAVLGTIVSDGRLFQQVLTLLSPNVFHTRRNQQVCTALFSLQEKGLEIDLMSVKIEYQRLGFGGQEADELPIISYLADITSGPTLYASLKQKCLFLLELFYKRQLWQFAAKLMQQAADPVTDALSLMDAAQDWLDKLLADRQSLGEKGVDTILGNIFARIEQQKQSPESIAGLSSGINAVDRITAGLKPGNLIVLAARPAMGKSAAALHIVRHLLLALGLPVGVISLEMTAEEVVQRLLAAETGYSNFQLDRGDCDLSILHRNSGRLSRAPIAVHDRPISLMELRLKAYDWKRRRGIALLVVDYLQLVSVPGAKTETEQVGLVSRTLKEIASELGIPVLALSQLNRDSETRKDFDKRPMLSDLRQSGQIEQDANGVWFLFRPAYYSLNYPDGSATDQTLEIHIAKNRNGPTTERDNPLLVRYDRAINTLYDYPDNGFQPLPKEEVNF